MPQAAVSHSVLGWHSTFGRQLSGGHTLPDPGVTLVFDPNVRPRLAFDPQARPRLVPHPCGSGFYAAERILETLPYGPTLSRVSLSGQVRSTSGIHRGSERTILWTLDADVMEPLLHEFACWCAEQALGHERDRGREPDARVWAAMDTKRKWVQHRLTDAELATAHRAVCAAARQSPHQWDVDGHCAHAAARNATLLPAHEAAPAAAREAARAIAREARIVIESAPSENRWRSTVPTVRAIVSTAQNAHLEQMVRAAAAAAGCREFDR